MKSKPKCSEHNQPSIMNPICRHDDIFDIFTSDADHYNVTNTTRSTTVEQPQQTTQSVVEID